jgi:hypothetical protein
VAPLQFARSDENDSTSPIAHFPRRRPSDRRTPHEELGFYRQPPDRWIGENARPAPIRDVPDGAPPGDIADPSALEPHPLTAESVLAALATDARTGLNRQQPQRRLELFGRNEIAAEKPVPAWRKLLGQFTDVLVILLLIAALLSAGLWLYERQSALPYEAMAIFAIVPMGYVQQARAEQALAALRRTAAARANVIQDGAPKHPGNRRRARRHSPDRGRRHRSRRRARDPIHRAANRRGGADRRACRW